MTIDKNIFMWPSCLTFSLLTGLIIGLVSCSAPPINPSLSDGKKIDQAIDSISRSPSSAHAPTDWDYDAGPEDTDIGKELTDLNASIPYFPGISQLVMGGQKFRPAFGPIPWRMLQKPNTVKILFIGQDGTHIAEAAGRPATAGFGGRAQDLAKYFGVSSSAAFMNAYAFTIKGQYNIFDAPVLHKGADGKWGFNASADKFGDAFVNNQLWLMSIDQQSPITKWRNALIEWIIRNNRDSLQMIVLFGGAARDAAAAFVESKGGQVGGRYTEEDLASVKVPKLRIQRREGNYETLVPLSKNGKDLYATVLGRNPKYEDEKDLLAAQLAFAKAFKEDPDKLMGEMDFSNGGLHESGLIHPAQVGGFDIDRKMQIDGKTTISLKGLKISDDLTIDHDLLVVQLPHPTALSMMTPQMASKAVGKELEGFKPYVKKGWRIEPDPGFEDLFFIGAPYKYGRAHMGPEYYDFGAPASRMVDVSSASRMSPNVIVFGTRDKAKFDNNAITAMTKAKPSKLPSDKEMWTARPRTKESRYIFDPGPGEKFARLMKENLSKDLIENKKHEVNGDFGHYRGTFSKPRVLIVADPDGYDDLITARALTGTRGQYLHGLMEAMGVKDKYLVIKTAPFSLVETDLDDWKDIIKQTQKYREKLIGEILSDGKPSLILTDGTYATQEVARILGGNKPCPIVEIKRDVKKKDAGIAEVIQKIRKISGFEKTSPTVKMADIPRHHLSYYARLWEGTSGDRVITSSDSKYAGMAFAEVAPDWATKQRFTMSKEETEDAKNLVKKLKDLGILSGDL